MKPKNESFLTRAYARTAIYSGAIVYPTPDHSLAFASAVSGLRMGMGSFGGSSLTSLTKFTINFWGKFLAAGTATHTILALDVEDGLTPYTGVYLRRASDERITFSLSDYDGAGASCTVAENATVLNTAGRVQYTIQVDTTQATAANRIKIYRDGSEVAYLAGATYPTQNSTPLASIGVTNSSNIYAVVGGRSSAFGNDNYFASNIYMPSLHRSIVAPASFSKTVNSASLADCHFCIDGTGSLGHDAVLSSSWTEYGSAGNITLSTDIS